ncbi:MAG TPA: hypothetical protein PKV16_05325 [Caldisericia bacterium]|nr:hypothetical protein [Caldisericia bacterium]HPF48733.1 hypothetical protein [Caldisericia bacterium]HPI83607.1 hypothetical protein [Caldisericia bacterium]HPQ93188.1 hypothetical protein [Caldisericia bacterium]HRV74979.1 hypothetical protein [Caldisericia bacterium]
MPKGGKVSKAFVDIELKIAFAMKMMNISYQLASVEKDVYKRRLLLKYGIVFLHSLVLFLQKLKKNNHIISSTIDDYALDMIIKRVDVFRNKLGAHRQDDISMWVQFDEWKSISIKDYCDDLKLLKKYLRKLSLFSQIETSVSYSLDPNITNIFSNNQAAESDNPRISSDRLEIPSGKQVVTDISQNDFRRSGSTIASIVKQSNYICEFFYRFDSNYDMDIVTFLNCALCTECTNLVQNLFTRNGYMKKNGLSSFTDLMPIKTRTDLRIDYIRAIYQAAMDFEDYLNNLIKGNTFINSLLQYRNNIIGHIDPYSDNQLLISGLEGYQLFDRIRSLIGDIYKNLFELGRIDITVGSTLMFIDTRSLYR